MPPTSGAWPRKEAMFWQQAPFFRLLLPLLAGIFVYDRLGTGGVPAGGSLSNLLLIVLASWLIWLFLQLFSRQEGWMSGLRFLLLQVFFFLTGWLTCFFNDGRNAADWYGRRLADSSLVLALVTEPPRELAKTQKLEVRLLAQINRTQKLEPASGKAFLLVYKKEGAPLYQRGDTLLFPGRWQAVTNSSNPFAFDYARFCQRRGIYHQTFAGAAEVFRTGRAQPDHFSWLWKINEGASRQLRRYVADPAAFGLLQAMLLGNEQDFDPELRQAYADTGVVHIVSISGSHTAMLFLVVTWLFFWLRKARWQWLKYATGVGLVWAYVLVAGAPPSALRSAVMFTVFALSFMLEQEQQPLNTLLLAAFALLLANPMFLFAIGFQLSFVAVLSLILFYQPVYSLWPQRTWLGRRLWQLIAGSLAVEILIAPLVAFYFHNFPLLVLVANIAAMLLLGIVALVGGLAILAFSWWPFLAGLLGWVVRISVSVFHQIIRYLQSLSPASLKQLQLSLPELLLIYAIIVFIVIYLFKKKKPALFTGLALLIPLLVLLLKDQYQALQQQRLIVYQVSNHACVDVLVGKSFIAIGDDTAAGDQHAVSAARTGYGAWRPAREQLPAAFIFKDKKILLWQQSYLPQGAIPTDILILSDSLQHHSLQALSQAFPAKQIVVTGSQSRWLLRRWADSARLQGRAFHSVLLDGAFVLE